MSDFKILSEKRKKARCSNCKYLHHEVRYGHEDGDIIECTNDENKIDLKERNIYEAFYCKYFESLKD